jgi:hydrogenase nickel incorporation protein HypA/HybF
MHELSITRSIVAIVSEKAEGRAVLRVKLEVGRLSGMLPDAIRFCFDVCTRGTPLQDAALEIVDVGGLGRCSGCGAEHALNMPLGRCPSCGEPSLAIVAGQDLRIKEMEVQ